MESVSSGEMLDLAAFDRLFGEYRPRFIRFAVSYVTDAAVAEDLVMESFMAAWERRALLSEKSFPPYVLVIVRNKCLNHLRSRQVRLRAEEDLNSHRARLLELRVSTLEACEPAQLFSDEARRLVDETLARLPERTREIFQRSRFRGESYKEIAASMGTTVKSVEFEVSKAMKSLRVSLRDYLPLFYLFLLIDK
ncbi:RNA polymerase sigma-70 factor [uncultured Alistipes sp.]|jgi:RNA polymerase sigma-70 factor (ECF subfamily)|uniref:RNA polymerase sigma-70 factor n=1 Tax=uncultured Alistipes sp. TaxID=538949 RepID=UPI001F86B9EA|nr:RNA polymerase sigma-70 factor [uncultured Alistipes sp.]HJC16671.1 RNA polymerase sigma-70 factor [Candidatus Alistipes stercorigallinarum]